MRRPRGKVKSSKSVVEEGKEENGKKKKKWRKRKRNEEVDAWVVFLSQLQASWGLREEKREWRFTSWFKAQIGELVALPPPYTREIRPQEVVMWFHLHLWHRLRFWQFGFGRWLLHNEKSFTSCQICFSLGSQKTLHLANTKRQYDVAVHKYAAGLLVRVTGFEQKEGAEEYWNNWNNKRFQWFYHFFLFLNLESVFISLSMLFSHKLLYRWKRKRERETDKKERKERKKVRKKRSNIHNLVGSNRGVHWAISQPWNPHREEDHPPWTAQGGREFSGEQNGERNSRITHYLPMLKKFLKLATVPRS